MSSARPHLLRVLLLASIAIVSVLSFGSCHAPGGGVPPQGSRTPIEKPWTKAAIESHRYLWLELSTGKRGLMTGPVLASDEKGEYLTTQKDATVHLPLADVTVMEAVELPPQDGATAAGTEGQNTAARADGSNTNAKDEGPPVQGVGTSLLAFWGGLIFFVPTILLIVLLT